MFSFNNPHFFMISAMVLSGTIGVIVNLTGLPVTDVVFYRCLFGSVFLGIYVWHKGYFKELGFSLKVWGLMLISGVALVTNWVALFYAYRSTSIGIATAIYHIQPFFVFFAGAIWFGEKITLFRVFCIIFAFVGTVLIVNPTSPEFSNPVYVLGCLSALFSAILYAITTLLTKQLKGQVKPHVIAFFQMLLGIFMLLPLAGFNTFPDGVTPWGAVLTLGLVHSCIMYIIMYDAFQRLPAATIAILAFIYPVVAVSMDYVVYGKLMTFWQLLGGVVVLGASLSYNVFGAKRLQHK